MCLETFTVNDISFQLPNTDDLYQLLKTEQAFITGTSEHKLLIIQPSRHRTMAAKIEYLTDKSREEYLDSIELQQVKDNRKYFETNIDFVNINITDIKYLSPNQIYFLVGHEIGHIMYKDVDHNWLHMLITSITRNISDLIFYHQTFAERRADEVGFHISRINKQDAILALTYDLLDVSNNPLSTIKEKLSIICTKRMIFFIQNKRFK